MFWEVVPMNPLIPSVVMDLRLSCTSLRSLGGGADFGTPYILWLPADETFCLHAYGSPQAKHGDARVLGECMRRERAEPGFIRRILSASEPCTEAALAEDDKAALNERRAGEAHKQRIYREEQAALRARRANQIDVSRINLDDL